jgi:hypothetical protein
LLMETGNTPSGLQGFNKTNCKCLLGVALERYVSFKIHVRLMFGCMQQVKSSDQEQQGWTVISGLNTAFGCRTLNGFHVWLRLNDFSNAVNLKRALKCSMCIVIKCCYFIHRTYF